MAASVPEQDMVVMAMVLDESDIPGACLSDPMDQHTKPQLRWWLLCSGIKAPTSYSKQQLVTK